MSWSVASAVVWVLLGPPSGTALDRLRGSDDANADPAAKIEAVPDESLRRRLREVYAEIDGLEAISVEVNAGVVSLGGEAPSEAKRDKAIRLAQSTPGVVDVANETSVATGVGPRLQPAFDNLEARFFDLIARLPLLAVAIGVVGVFAVIAKFVGGRKTLFGRVVRNPFLRSLLQQAVATVVVVIGIVTALELLDATGIVGAILGAAGIVGLAVGFAFKDTVENYIASVLMTMRQPFDPNDHVSIGEHEGRIVRLTSRATILMTLDGNHVRIPNADVFKATMINYSRNPRRRFQFDVGVGTTDDLVEATALAVDTLNAMEGVMDDPPPEAHVLELGESNVQVRVFGWVDQSSYDFLRVRSEAVRLVKTAFDDEAVSMPEPTYNIRLWDEKQSFGLVRPSRPEDSKRSVAVQADIRPDRNIEKQVADEQARHEDLLHAAAQRE